MLDSDTVKRILSLTFQYWRTASTTPEFVQLASGKEIGHRIADYVDERTTELIAGNLTARHQHTSRGSLMSRSMGDIWILSNGMYNPVNVKAGEAGKNGQPNMVSLKRLLRALLLNQLDSYYLLIVKMKLRGDNGVTVYLVDVLNYLDYTAFDSGPGQIMLKERQFYEAMERETENAKREPAGGADEIVLVPTSLTIDDKIGKLFAMLEDADRRLLKNRERVWRDILEMREAYAAGRGQPIDQTALNLR